MASRVLYETNNPKMLRGLVGDKLTKEFIKFITLKTYQLNDIIENSEELDISMSLDEKYLTAYTMSFVDEEYLLKASYFIKKLGNDVYDFFKLLWKYNQKNKEINIQEEKVKLKK